MREKIFIKFCRNFVFCIQYFAFFSSVSPIFLRKTRSRARWRINNVGKNSKKSCYALDEQRKKCYDDSMENNTEINKIIAKNLVYYRKEAGLTQAELAEKINYSDKSVSKWESANGAPDVYTLMQLAELYGVTLNDLVRADEPEKKEKRPRNSRVWIMLLSSGIVWLVATCFFITMQLWVPEIAPWWLAFLYAVAANAIVLIVFAGMWKYKIAHFISVSTLIWSALTCIYLTARFIFAHFKNDYSALWLVFILGVPLQVLECFWGLFRAKKIKEKEQKEEKTEPAQAVENQADGE
jgi:transcriptional regulator with XRE-family HTH domain